MQGEFIRVFLVLSIQLLTVWSLCPAPFAIEAGKCIFVNGSESFNWCEANRLCTSIGGELINSYSSLQLLSSMPSASCGCKLWLGVTDLADERNSSRSGWQLVNGNGILPLDNSLWLPNMPSNNKSNQNCIVTSHSNLKFIDMKCSRSRAFVCEFVEAAPTQPFIESAWKLTPFKRTNYNPSAEYCYTDLLQVDSAIECVAAAQNSGSSEHVLYNSKLRTCRLLLFTDSQVEEEIETSAEWVKFSLY